MAQRQSCEFAPLLQQFQLRRDLDLVASPVSDKAILEAMVENPILIERPLVETEKGVRLCRPQDRVREIL